MYTFDENTLSDLHKDARGFRPRSDYFWSQWNNADNDGKQAIWDGLIDELSAELEAEKARDELCLTEFKALVAHYIECGAGDRETALRWMVQHETFHHSQDVEHFVWEHGILFTDYGRELVKELIEIVEFVEYEF